MRKRGKRIKEFLTKAGKGRNPSQEHYQLISTNRLLSLLNPIAKSYNSRTTKETLKIT